jgi:hypothetical protein
MTILPHFTVQEVLAMFDSLAVLSYPTDGGVQVLKAGVIGFGLTVSEAVADWGRRFAQMIALPKPPPAST